jgi:predicted transcriptional regulator of viral defense system
MRGKRAIDQEIAALAGAQYGVVSRAHLRAIGLSDDAVDRRIARGRLHAVHRGVYAVGHPVLTIEGRWMAAVLAGGADAVLSHASAAAAWDLRPTGSGAIHVTVPGDRGRRRRAGLRVHRSVTLEQSDTTTRRGIPITTPLRTILDLAATVDGRPLEHALDLAEQHGLIDFAELHHRSVPASLRAVLALYTAGSTVTRSEMEERFLALCDHYGLPRPATNTRIEGHEVDFVWREARLVVEVDGYRYHRSPSRFESDRERDVILAVAGWQVLRFTWAKITGRAAWVARAISSRLAR